MANAGWSAESSVNAAVVAAIQTVPLKPTGAPTRATSSSYTQLSVDWSTVTGTDTGDSPILSYHL
jgi:hypothetical protein